VWHTVEWGGKKGNNVRQRIERRNLPPSGLRVCDRGGKGNRKRRGLSRLVGQWGRGQKNSSELKGRIQKVSQSNESAGPRSKEEETNEMRTGFAIEDTRRQETGHRITALGQANGH